MQKKLLLSGMVMGILLLACSKKEELKKHISYYSDGRAIREEWSEKITPTGEVKHGTQILNYKNWTHQEMIQWKDGQKEGVSQAWYESGTLKWEKYYTAGKKNGKWMLYYPHGGRAVILNYENDFLDGESRLWAFSGDSVGVPAVFKKGACQSGNCLAFEVSTSLVNKKSAEDVLAKLMLEFKE